MKRVIILCLSILTISLYSCDDWLTVEPKATDTRDKMFQSEAGFRTALIGVYLELQRNYTPSSFMMGGSLEYMANNYDFLAGSDAELYSTHQYTSTTIDSSLGSIFLQFYKIIANVNVLLDEIEKQQVLSEQEATLIKGEALAIRAFCHFELLRLWGPVPTQVNSAINYIPYAKEFNTDPYDYLPYDQFCKYLLSDLLEAEKLLEQTDPINKYSNSMLNTGYTSINEYPDIFWYFRQKRFNLFGIKGLLARFYHWTGDTNNAYLKAKEVYEAKNQDNTSKFALGTSSDISSYTQDYLLYKEHLLGLDIFEWVDQYGTFSGRAASLVIDEQMYRNILFEGQTDMRMNLFTQSFAMVSFGKTVYGTKKFSYLSETSYNSPKSIPLLRLSEIYLILMETAPSIEEANQYYQAFRAKRDASYTPLTNETRQREILKEYVREFFSESQSFFAYKRLNSMQLIMSGKSIQTENYVLPIPSEETGDYK